MTNTDQRIDPKTLNGNEKIAWKNIKHTADFIIGGLENGLEDEEEGSEEYINYQSALNDHDGLVNQTVWEATHGEFGPGYAHDRVIKEMRFAGNEFIRKAAHQIIADMGY